MRAFSTWLSRPTSEVCRGGIGVEVEAGGAGAGVDVVQAVWMLMSGGERTWLSRPSREVDGEGVEAEVEGEGAGAGVDEVDSTEVDSTGVSMSGGKWNRFWVDGVQSLKSAMSGDERETKRFLVTVGE